MFTRLTTLALLLISSFCAHALEKITIGVTSGPHLDVLEFVREEARKQDLEIVIKEFSDFTLPNIALDDGALDLNSYQHQPFLDAQIKARGYKLTSIGKTLLFPIGVYSKKITDLSDLPRKAKIAIPNDPSNGARALLLLAKQGLITLRTDNVDLPCVFDILENPKKIKFIEVDAASLPRALQDVDAAVINTDFALLTGLNPTSDAIVIESVDSPYTNIVVSRTKDADKEVFKKFLSIYQTQKTKDFVKKKFGSNVIAAW